MPPSDEEMIRHFTTHEVAFRKVYEIMAESSEGSFHYPPLSPEEVIILDSMEQSMPGEILVLLLPYPMLTAKLSAESAAASRSNSTI